MDMKALYPAGPLALVGAMIAGLFCRVIPRWAAHTAGPSPVSDRLHRFLSSLEGRDGRQHLQRPGLHWLTSGDYTFEVGFLIDPLTATMMLVVTFGLADGAHIYTIGYMHDDPGYNRFFSYISLFTFSMLMLAMSNNFMQLFFGWEAGGLCPTC